MGNVFDQFDQYRRQRSHRKGGDQNGDFAEIELEKGRHQRQVQLQDNIRTMATAAGCRSLRSSALYCGFCRDSLGQYIVFSDMVVFPSFRDHIDRLYMGSG